LELILEQPEKNQKEILLEFAKKEFDIKWRSVIYVD
jgi:hypothetical protein